MPEFEWDPERALWRPRRRVFVFMLGGAVAGALVPPGRVLTEEMIVHACEQGVRNRMLDPRLVWRATMAELHGDNRLTRELGMPVFRSPEELRRAGLKL